LKGNALKKPKDGGPLVVTTTEADESPQDKVKINDDEGGSILLLITRFTSVSLFAGREIRNGDTAAMLRLNEALLTTDHADRQTILVITSALRTNFTWGLTYVTAWTVEVINIVGIKVSATVGILDDAKLGSCDPPDLDTIDGP
jgi:hypothetical protein